MSAAKTVKVTIAGKKYKLKVLAPKSIAKGRSGSLQLSLSKPAAKRLKGGTAKVSLKLKVTYSGSTVSKTVRAKIKR